VKTKKTRKRKRRTIASFDDEDDDDDPPITYAKKKRGASANINFDKTSEQKLKKQLRKIMDIVIKYTDR